jgi:hypothetical protein
MSRLFYGERDVLKCLYICVFISVADILNEMDPFMIDLFGFYFSGSIFRNSFRRFCEASAS